MAQLTFKRGARDVFFDALFPLAKENRDLLIVTADNGAPSLDQFRTKLPQQFITVGIAEQNMVAVAAGLALAGKKPFVYAIAPFATLRCYEQIKVDACAMNLPIKILGVGAGFSYDIMGPTHHTTEDLSIMRALPGMTIFSPSDCVMAAVLPSLLCAQSGPAYVRFDREVFLSLYPETSDFSQGVASLREGKDVCVIATGVMVHSALRVADRLKKSRINLGVIDLYRAAPINTELFLSLVSRYRRLITLEEHFLIGGIGDAVRSVLACRLEPFKLCNLGVPHKYYFEYGGRHCLHELTTLNDDALVKSITQMTQTQA